MKNTIKICREDLRYFDRFITKNNIKLNCIAIYSKSIYLGDSPNNYISWDTDCTDDNILKSIINFINILIVSDHLLKFEKNKGRN